MKERSVAARKPKVWQFRLFLFLLLLALASAIFVTRSRLRPRPLAPAEPIDCILIEKSERRLTTFRRETEVKRYRVALGQNPVGPKEREGDRKTPEGLYWVDGHKPDSDFHRALHISYPSSADRARAVAGGWDAGSDIEIHGLPNEAEPDTFSNGSDWTAGCIALLNDEIDELFPLTRDGTTVEITP
jgi:murein L,D-transpeptidase YafK